MGQISSHRMSLGDHKATCGDMFSPRNFFVFMLRLGHNWQGTRIRSASLCSLQGQEAASEPLLLRTVSEQQMIGKPVFVQPLIVH